MHAHNNFNNLELKDDLHSKESVDGGKGVSRVRSDKAGERSF